MCRKTCRSDACRCWDEVIENPKSIDHEVPAITPIARRTPKAGAAQVIADEAKALRAFIRRSLDVDERTDRWRGPK